MEPLETLEVKIKGITPEQLDIADLQEFLDHIQSLLYPGIKKRDRRPHVSVDIQKGSTALMARTEQTPVRNAQDFIETAKTATNPAALNSKMYKALEYFQRFSKENNLDVNIRTTLSSSQDVLEITPYTHYSLDIGEWYETELNIYGRVVRLGGKTAPTLHLDTEEYGVVSIKTLEKDLMRAPRLYSETGVSIRAMQNITTGMVQSQAEFIEFIQYDPSYDLEYIDACIKKATPDWEGVGDSVEWVRSIRGSNEET